MLGLCRIWISLAPGHLNIRSSRNFSSIKKSLEQRAEINLLPAEASHVLGVIRGSFFTANNSRGLFFHGESYEIQ